MRNLIFVFSLMLGISLLNQGCQSKAPTGNNPGSKDSSALLLTPAQLKSFFEKNVISTVFLLSNPECKNCKETETYLSSLSATPQALFILKKINFIENMEDAGKKGDLNILNTSDAKEVFPKHWKGKFPAIFISNPMKNISLFFEGPFSEKELEAILTPVTN